MASGAGHGPVVDSHGVAYAVDDAGAALAVGGDGTERWRVGSNLENPSPAVLLSDDTLVFVGTADKTTEAVGIRDGSVVWRTRVGLPSSTPAAPLPLEDGGVVVAAAFELAALDADGGQRARAVLPEPVMTLLPGLGKVVAVTSTGSVWTWMPGGLEPNRVASFGGAAEGGVVLLPPRTLLSVLGGGTRLSALDLATAVVTTRAEPLTGLWAGPPTVSGDRTYLFSITASAQIAVALSATGQELGRGAVGPGDRSTSADGGALSPVSRSMLADRAGVVVFATDDGSVGTVLLNPPVGGGGTPSVERLAHVCPSTAGGPHRLESPVAGLAPLAPGGFVVTCRAGTLLAVRGH
jgi:hypothetical protein